jgi:hypothetical protein
LKKLIQENSRSSKVVAQKLFKQTGKHLSHWSIKRLSKDFGLSWKRIRKSLKSKRDINQFRKAKSELEAFSLVALTNAKNPPKNENKAEPITKASESDIEVFKQGIELYLIIIDEFPNSDKAQNIAKVVKPKTNVVATKTDSSKEDVLNEVTLNSEPRNEGYQFNETNELCQHGAECKTFEINASQMVKPKTQKSFVPGFRMKLMNLITPK